MVKKCNDDNDCKIVSVLGCDSTRSFGKSDTKCNSYDYNLKTSPTINNDVVLIKE